MPALAEAPREPAIDTDALRRHLDRAVPAALAVSGAPGAVVSVVQGERVLVAGGWGLADVASARAMDGDTVVRIASLSKTFTATAVARLEAEGRLDVDAPVDAALASVAVPARFAEAVTLRHLLSHTGGFINDNAGRISASPLHDTPHGDLSTFLLGSMPPQLYPPGAGVLYSNHGNALAGLAVQDVAGMTFEAYVRSTILEPLGMDDSGYELDARMNDALATSYVLADGVPQPHPYWHFKTVPASSLMSTASDMARYMIMHLQGGRFEGREIVPAEAAARMREPVSMLHPELPTYHYAFAFGTTAGHSARTHGGSVPAFLSRVVLFDELGVGIFVAQNAFGDSIADAIVDGIATEFLPPPPPVAIEQEGDGRAPPQAEVLRGAFVPLTGRETSAFTRPLVQLLEDPVVVDLDRDGFLTVDGDRFTHGGDLVFRRQRQGKPPEVVAFVRGSDGRTWLHRGLSSSYSRPWHAARWLHAALWLLALLVLVPGSLLPAAWSRVPARHRWRLIPTAYAARLVLAGVLVPPLYAAWFDRGQPDYVRPLRFGIPTWITVVDALPWMGAAVLLGLSVSLPWRSDARVRIPRLRAATLGLTAAAIVVLALRLYWRVPGPGLLPAP
jgi:CubicO group peptidase (beta-lactamase class C family)